MAGRIALFPGSFDPFTNGHLDIVATASLIFDSVDVAVGTNASKKPLLTAAERVELIEASVSGIGNVTVSIFDGLVVDHARKLGAAAIVRGLRQAVDFEYEQRMAVANRELHPDLPTVFLSPRPKNLLISSTIVRDVHSYGGDISRFVPEPVRKWLDNMNAD